MAVTAYPLAWPPGWPRTPSAQRESSSRFKQGSRLFGDSIRIITFDGARRKLRDELARLGAGEVVLSSNLPLRADGEARADAGRYRIDDPGVAIYFSLKGKQMAMACDRFDAPAGNARSLGLAIEGMRQLERHGGGAMMERAFAGFTAIAPPRSCWVILGVRTRATSDEVRAAFKARAMETGAGGNVDMDELVRARDEALQDVAG